MSDSHPTFALELLENIFDELRFITWEGLENCALACRLFTVIARKILFRNVTITFNENDNHETGSSSQFLSFLASHPHISSCIRRFQLDYYPITWHNMHEVQDYRTMFSNKLADIMHGLVGLETLTVNSSFYWDWTKKDPRIKASLTQFFHISTLQHLELHGLELTQTELIQLTGIPKLTLFLIILCSSDSSAASVSLYGSIPEKTCLRDLMITLTNPEMAEDTFEVARMAGATLQRLKWTSTPYYGFVATCLDIIDLSVMPVLTFLSVSTPLDKDYIAKLTNMMQSVVVESKLQVLEIVYDYHVLPDEMTDSTWRWDKLDAALTSAAHPNLQKVVVVIKKSTIPNHRPIRDYEEHCEEALSLFENKLPRLQSKGIIFGPS